MKDFKHLNSKNKADFGMFILVLRINLATLYCHDSRYGILASEDGIQIAQPWAIDGRITDFHKASPK